MKLLKWPTLARHREIDDLVMYHRIVKEKVCIAIEDIRKPSTVNYHLRGTANPTSFQIDNQDENQYKHSFFQRTTPNWNWLPEEVTELENPKPQIAALLENKTPPPQSH